MLTTKAQPPDVAAAWRYADSTVALSSEQTRAYDRLYNDILVADVLARAGLGDSARRVLERSKGDPSVDPQGDLAFLAAFTYVLLDDKPKAIDQLKTYLTSSPGRRESFKDDPGWLFRDLQGEPAYQRLMGTAH